MPAIIILVAAPLSLGGALALLWLTGTDLNISSAMGLILLVGLVVKNGIMLLDFSESQHAAGEPFDTAIAHNQIGADADRQHGMTRRQRRQKLRKIIGIRHKILRGAGHINVASGFGEWPLALEWVEAALSQ